MGGEEEEQRWNRARLSESEKGTGNSGSQAAVHTHTRKEWMDGAGMRGQAGLGGRRREGLGRGKMGWGWEREREDVCVLCEEGDERERGRWDGRDGKRGRFFYTQIYPKASVV